MNYLDAADRQAMNAWLVEGPPLFVDEMWDTVIRIYKQLLSAEAAYDNLCRRVLELDQKMRDQ